MRKGQPKKNIVPIRFKDKSFGNERRRNFPREILYKETELPKPLNYDDIDSSFEEFLSSFLLSTFTVLFSFLLSSNIFPLLSKIICTTSHIFLKIIVSQH